MRAWVVLLLVVSALLAGCHTGEKACRSLRDAFKDKLMECYGLSEEQAKDAWKEVLASDGGESCQDVDDIRDPDEFWDECLPMYEMTTCEELDMSSGALPEACHDQLILIDPPGG